MTKHQTPMSVLKAHFNNFEEIISDFIDTKAMNKLELNKSRPHHNPYGESSRGVSSDFIRIYQDKTNVVGKKKANDDFYSDRNEYNSFAFVFNYMEVDEPYIVITVKIDGKDYTSSHAYSVEQMKERMSSFNKYLKTITIRNPARLIKLVQDLFISDNAVDDDKLLEDSVSSINETLSTLNKDIETQQRTYNSVKVMYVNSSEKYEEALQTSEEYENVEKLKKQLREAEEKLSKKNRQLKVDYRIKEKKSTLKYESSLLSKLKNEKERTLSKLIKQYPYHLRQDILDKIS